MRRKLTVFSQSSCSAQNEITERFLSQTINHTAYIKSRLKRVLSTNFTYPYFTRHAHMSAHITGENSHDPDTQ